MWSQITTTKAQILLALGRRSEARALLAETLLVARARLEQGHPDEAKPLLERARRIAATTDLSGEPASVTELAKRL